MATAVRSVVKVLSCLVIDEAERQDNQQLVAEKGRVTDVPFTIMRRLELVGRLTSQPRLRVLRAALRLGTQLALVLRLLRTGAETARRGWRDRVKSAVRRQVIGSFVQ